MMHTNRMINNTTIATTMILPFGGRGEESNPQTLYQGQTAFKAAPRANTVALPYLKIKIICNPL